MAAIAQKLQHSLTWMFALWALTFGAYGAFKYGRDYASTNVERARSFLSDDAETRFIKETGRHFDLIKAIRHQVPSGEEIIFHGSVDPNDRLPQSRIRQLGNIIFPRTLVQVAFPAFDFPRSKSEWKMWGTGHRFLLQRNRSIDMSRDFELLLDVGWIRLFRMRGDAMSAMGFGALAWTLGTPWLLGASILAALGIRWREDRTGFVAWAWLAGALATGLVCMASLALGLPFSLLRVLPLAALVPFSLVAWRRAPSPGFHRDEGPSKVFCLLAALVMIAATVHVLAANASPVTTNDEGDFWSLRAKIMYVCGDFGDDWRWHTAPERSPIDLAHDYPELNPLLQFWVYVNAGEIVHFENRLPIQFFALATLLMMMSLLGCRVRPWLAISLVVIYATSDHFLRMSALAYGDLMVAAGATLALQGWLRYRESGATKFAALGALGLSIATWSKNEGLLLLLTSVAVLLFVALKVEGSVAERLKRHRRPAAWLLLPLGFAALARGFNLWFGFKNELLNPASDKSSPLGRALSHLPEHSGTYLEWFFRELLGKPAVGHAIILVFAVLLLLAPKRFVSGARAVPILVILLFFAGVSAVFFSGTREFAWYLQTSGRRVFFQMAPAIIVLAASFVAELNTKIARIEP